MTNYTLRLLDDAGHEVGEIECCAANPWLALEKSRTTIGRRMVELRDEKRTYGRFRKAFPAGQVWELSPALRAVTRA